MTLPQLLAGNVRRQRLANGQTVQQLAHAAGLAALSV